jgi:predicted nucleic acid-binding protein
MAPPERPFFDTNILLYSISRDPTEALKRERAIELLDGDDGALSVQVLDGREVEGIQIINPFREIA